MLKIIICLTVVRRIGIGDGGIGIRIGGATECLKRYWEQTIIVCVDFDLIVTQRIHRVNVTRLGIIKN